MYILYFKIHMYKLIHFEQHLKEYVNILVMARLQVIFIVFYNQFFKTKELNGVKTIDSQKF